MALTNGEAHAVNTLLDYYQDKPNSWSAPSDQRALDAWMELTGKAHKTLMAGWRQVDIEKHFAPKQNALSDYSHDAEDCQACDAVNDICPFHRGIFEGINAARKAMVAIDDDPELLNGLLADHERMKRAEKQHEAERQERET